ncbi:MAG: YihY/virulence factor BrkB family protein [Butyrivibrio sp.]|nr:YihY/virulence factor BrkB family protein [Butyrivibrio sp.]
MERLRSLISLAKRFSDELRHKNIPAFAGSTSYFLFMSLIPMLILCSLLLPYTTLTRQDLTLALLEATPKVIDDLVEEIVEDAYANSGGLFSVSAILMIWTGATGMLSLIRGLNAIWDVDERRNYLQLRCIASFYTLIMLIALVLMLMLGVFGEKIRHLIQEAVPGLHPLLDWIHQFRFLLLYAVVILFFAMIYTFVPSIRQRFVYQLPGAIFSGVVWNIFSGFFSLYVNSMNSFSIYGSLGTIVICMVWMYVGITLLFIGAFLNQFFQPAFTVFYGQKKK